MRRWLVPCLALAACAHRGAVARDLTTASERSGWVATGRHDEAVRLCHDVARAHPDQARCETFGTSPGGRAMVALLTQFVRQPGVVLTRRQLLQDVFGTTNEGYARNVDCHVTRLRRKLEVAGLAPAPIHAVHGTGYRLGAA